MAYDEGLARRLRAVLFHRSRTHILNGLLTITTLCLLVWPEVCRPGQTGTVILKNLTLVDGTGAAPRPGQVLTLRGESIVSIDTVTDYIDPVGATVYDLSGRFVIPGLVDLHVHLPGEPEIDEAVLLRLLHCGITTILNPGARPGTGVDLREKIRSGKIIGPHMYTAGRVIDLPPGDSDLATWAAAVETSEQVRTEVESQSQQGVDFLKLYRHLPAHLVEAAIDEAHRRELRVVGHMGETTWAEAASAGIDMLVHSGWGTPMDEIVNLEQPEVATDTEWYLAYADAPEGARFAAVVAALLANDVVVVPTLSIHQASGLGADSSMLPLFQTELAPEANIPGWWGDNWRLRHPQYDPDSVEEAEMMATVYFPGILNIIRAYHERGVRLAVGTDVGNAWMTPGIVYHHELGLYQEAGIPPLAILSMATRNGAEALDALERLGTIEPGKRADLVVLSRDPSVDIRNTRFIDNVFLAGSAVHPDWRSKRSDGEVCDPRLPRP